MLLIIWNEAGRELTDSFDESDDTASASRRPARKGLLLRKREIRNSYFRKKKLTGYVVSILSRLEEGFVCAKSSSKESSSGKSSDRRAAILFRSGQTREFFEEIQTKILGLF